MKSKMIVFSLIIVMVLGFSYGITNNSNNDNEIVTVISSIYPEYSLDELVKYSDLIVFGEVIDISKPFEIIPAGGGDSSIFTDYKINIDTVIKDEFGGIDNSIILRFQGGRIGNETVEMEDIEDLNIGDKHIVFLEKPKTGGGYITDEDYYLLRGGAQGIFDIENGNEETVDLKKEFVSQDGEKRILYDNLTEILNHISIERTEEELDPLYGLKENLKSGFITQEEYDETIKDIKEYGVKIE